MAGSSWGSDVFGGDTAITVKKAQFKVGGFGVTGVGSGGGGKQCQLYSTFCK